MKGLVIAVCCLVALAVAEEEKLAEMSVQAPVSPGGAGSFAGQPLLGGTASAVGRQFMGLPGTGVNWGSGLLGQQTWGLPGQWGVGLPGQLGVGLPGQLGGWGQRTWWGGGYPQPGVALPGQWGVGYPQPGVALPGQGPWVGGAWNQPSWGGFQGPFGGLPFGGYAGGQALVGQQPLGAGTAGGVKGTLKK